MNEAEFQEALLDQARSGDPWPLCTCAAACPGSEEDWMAVVGAGCHCVPCHLDRGRMMSAVGFWLSTGRFNPTGLRTVADMDLDVVRKAARLMRRSLAALESYEAVLLRRRREERDQAIPRPWREVVATLRVKRKP